MVMGGDSSPEGHEFESKHRILHGHFSHIFDVKLYCLFEKYENKRKEAGDGLFLYILSTKQLGPRQRLNLRQLGSNKVPTCLFCNSSYLQLYSLVGLEPTI